MKCAKEDLLLYAVTDRHWLNGRTLYEVVKESLDGGVTFLQLREKTLDEAHFLEEAKELQKLCKEYKVPFIINDNVDIAIAMNADGVHVGQSDMEAGDVRAKLGPDKIIGVSTQTVEQAILAEKHGADYLGVGAVFPTTSKDDAAEVSYDNTLFLGGGVGFFSKTLTYPYLGEKDGLQAAINELNRSFRKHRHEEDRADGISPRTTKDALYEGELYPYGLCEVKLS